MDKHEKRKQLLTESVEKTRKYLADRKADNLKALEREQFADAAMKKGTYEGYERHFKNIAKREYLSVFGDPSRFNEAWEEIKHELGKRKALEAVVDALHW